MISEELHDLLSLLVATIFADKRVFASEIESFMRVAKRLNSIHESKDHLSEAKLLAWFDTHKELIREQITGLNIEAWLHNKLARLSHLKNKDGVLDIMTDIAKSDKDFHVSEKALIVLTANYWKIESRI